MPFEQHPTDPDKLVMRAGNYNLQKPWVGLTDEERDAIQAATLDLHGIPKFFATAIEAKLQSKNT